ncbi:fructosamine kinase family protein [Tropicimonas sp. TH_r6]|uniref:fructosamine kinase family protein n=1 Tax=Tropicimonas sp. TH_r6 TaxID=3082085 RepID=UPI0029538240|nr:fructosamine kinase family protein [Tropicimonas sp. TH_r6]MDV7144511.1 fructosamine kinase family protein [Tropicimonas sp. TH_r6]
MARLNRIETAVSERLGLSVERIQSLHGGSLSEVWRLSLSDGCTAVAKSGPLVAQEAEMLRAISAAGAPAPKVLGVVDTVLLLEGLPETSASPAGWRALGQGLRQLHSQSAPHFGWSHDYAFGSVPIANGPASDWPGFWAESRLLPFLKDLPMDLARRVEALSGRLGDFLPQTPSPALLHGDLWTGNVLFGPDGAVHLIDPACYFGDPEVDLAMLALFNHPPAAFSESYGPLLPGAKERRAAYQLWPALVHMTLFGPGYRDMVEARLSRLGH